MTVKFITTIEINGNAGIDYKFEIDDSEQVDPIERGIAETLAAASLLEVQRISDRSGGLLTTE